MSRTEEAGGQFGEDHMLESIFGDRPHGYCVEVGAYDGVTGSASYRFERRGWHCLLIEPIPALVEEIRKHRACTIVNAAASSTDGEATFLVAENVEQMSTLEPTPEHLDWIREVGGAVKPATVRTARLDRLLEEAGFPEIQFITIDVEGHEHAVLEGFTIERYKPRVVIVEDNSVAGDPRVARYMSEHGYVHFHRTGVNEWFAHESDAELIQADRIRSFERMKARQRWQRRLARTRLERARRRVSHRIAVAVGPYVPAAAKRRLRAILDFARPTGPRH